MVDFLYSVMRRPIANDPEKRDLYHVDRAQKDARTKRIEEDDPQDSGQHNSGNSNEDEQLDDQNQKSKNKQAHLAKLKAATEEKAKEGLVPCKKGKGKYKDENGIEHLDIYV
jgi:hypothetical protein